MRAEIPETYKVPLVGSSSNSCMATAPPTKRGPYLNINTQLANSLGTSPLSPTYNTTVYTPSMARSVLLSSNNVLLLMSRPYSPWQQQATLPSCLPPPPSTPVGGLAGLPPNHPFLQDYAMLVLRNMNRQRSEAKMRS